MAFGDTAIIDDFTRSDRSLSGDNGWAAAPIWSADAIAQIISNQAAAGVSGWAGAYRGSISGNVEAYATLPAVTTAAEVSIWICLANPGASPDGYRFWWTTSTSGAIQRVDNGSTTNIVTFNTALNAGDAIGIDLIGTQVTAYRKPSGGSWGSIATVADATYSSGALAFEMEGTIWRLDDFGGGTPVSGGQPTAARWQNIPHAGPRLRIGGL
jgi:hypothetical protein